MGKRGRLSTQARILAGQVGAEAADKFKTVKDVFAGAESSKIPMTSLKTLARGAATGIAQAEVLKGKYKKGKKLMRTGVRVSKKVMDMFKKKKK